MPAKRELTMLQLRYLLRLHHDRVSAREIGRLLGVARSTIGDNLERAAAAGLEWPLAEAATDDVLDSMRHDLGDPAMKVLVLEIYQGYAGQTGKLIRDQLRLVAKDLNCGFVSSDGATVMPDGVHLTTASHEIMGARAAEVSLGLP